MLRGMGRFAVLIAFLLPAVDSPGAGQTLTDSDQQEMPDLYRDSEAMLIIGNVADAGTSWGRRELNPALAANGAFGWKSAVYKGAITASFVASEHLVVRGHPGRKRWVTWINFASAAVYYATAMHNLRVPVRAGEPPPSVP